MLTEKKRRKDLNPLKYSQQHNKQQLATEAMQPIRVLFWGNRVGKTEWGAQEVVRYALQEHPFRKIKYPPEIWCGCPSYDSQKETTQKKLKYYLPESRISDITYVKKNTWGEVVLDNGAKLNFKSYEQGREKFQGVGKRLVWFDEEPPFDIWEECFVRQEAGIPLDTILTMTAIKGMTWVYDHLYLDTGNKDLYISEAGWDDNPWLTKDQKEKMARGLTPEALKVRREGKFVKRSGLVCAWWRRDVHLRHYEELDRSWTWYEVLDGGFSDPACWLLIGVDGDDSIHIVDGYREKELRTEEIKSKRDGKVGGITLTSGWMDTDNPRLRDELSALGMSLLMVEKRTGESKSWDEILAEKLSEYGSVQKGTGQPRLFISDSLVKYDEKSGREINWLVQEVENLSWLAKKDKESSIEVKPLWDDHRKFGHHFDGVRALSYFLISYKKQVLPSKEYDKNKWRI